MAAILTLDVEDEEGKKKLIDFFREAVKGADDADKGTKKWTISFTELNQALEVGKKAWAFISTTTIGPMKEVIAQTAQWANDLTDLGEITGESTERLQEFAYAADQVGVGQEKVNASLQFFTRQMEGAVSGNEEMATQFKEWGIELLDAEGKMRSASEVMLDVNDVLSKMENGATKNALAMKFYGKSAGETIPFINLAREGMAGMTAEMDRLHLRVSAGSVAMANQYSENLEKMSALTTSLGIKLGSVFTPAFAVATDEVLRFTKEGLEKIDWDTVKVGAAEVVRMMGNVSTAFIMAGGAAGEMAALAKKGWNILQIGAKEVSISAMELARERMDPGSDEEKWFDRQIEKAKEIQKGYLGETQSIDELRAKAEEYVVGAGAGMLELTDKAAAAVEHGAESTKEMAAGVNELATEGTFGVEVMKGLGRAIEEDVSGGAERATETVEKLTGTMIRAVGTMQAFGTMPTWATEKAGDVASMIAARKGKFYQSGGSVDWTQGFGIQGSGWGGSGTYGQGDGTSNLSAAVQAGAILPGQASDLMTGRASAIVGDRFNAFVASMQKGRDTAAQIPDALKASGQATDELIRKAALLEQQYLRAGSAASSIGSRGVAASDDFINRAKRDGRLF